MVLSLQRFPGLAMITIFALIFFFPISTGRAARVLLTIKGGPLGFTAGPPSISPVELTGSEQTTTGTIGLFDIKDARGTGAGWQMTAQATDFVSRTDPDHTIPAAGLSISDTPTVVTIAGNGLPETARGPLDSPLKLLSAPVSAGMGHYRTEPEVNLDIPADTFAGTYDSTLTTTLISGP